jgi:hypothetical protein
MRKGKMYKNKITLSLIALTALSLNTNSFADPVATPNSAAPKKIETIFEAIESGNPKEVTKLINKDSINRIDRVTGLTPLHYACKGDNLEI